MKTIILTFFFNLLVVFSFAQTDSVKVYVDSALKVIQDNSLYIKNIKWNKIKKSVYKHAQQAKLELPQSRSFGTAFGGFPNITNGFPFFNQEYYFLLTVANLVNKDKKVFPHMISPQTEIKALENFYNIEKDPSVVAAIEWLK